MTQSAVVFMSSGRVLPVSRRIDDNRKPKWRFVKNVQDNICEYCFKVGDTLYRPKSDNFTFKLNV